MKSQTARSPTLSSWPRVVLLSLGGISVVALSFFVTLFVLQDLSDNSLTQSAAGVNFVVDPATLRVCVPPVMAKVSWNVAIPSIKRVDLFVVSKNGDENLVVGWNEVVGSASTGAWVGAGMVFVLRDSYTKKQLAKVAVGSENCN